MRFIEVPALITEDIEVPNIVDITETETVTASISGTTLTINGDSKVSGETTITLTGDVTVDAIIKENLRQPSIHKIIIKTNGAGNFTYVPNNTVTASSVSTTTKTGSDLDILLITTSGGDTYLDLDVADYVSPAANFSNVVTGFKVSELTSTYGATAKLYKPDGTLLTTVNSETMGSGVNFGYTESPGDVIYKLEVTDDLGRKSTYNLPRKWINYAMGTTSTPGFQKFRLEGIDYTTTMTLPSLGSSSTAKVYRTSDHGYMGIKFKIQGRNAPSDDWVDIANADENDDVLAFGDYTYQRVWVKPTAKATTTVSSSNVVTLTLSNLTEENVTTSFTGADPFEIDETSNVFVFEETAKIGTVPFTVTLGTETYTNAVTATTEEVSTVPNTDMTAAGPNKLHDIQLSQTGGYMSEASGNGKYIAYNKTNDSVVYILKGDPVSGYTDYTTITYSQVTNAYLVGSMTYDGKYIIIARRGSNSYHYEIWKHDESAETYTKLSQTVQTIDTSTYVHKPAFVPAESNYNFAISGHNSSSGQDFSVQLYKHTVGTDTWTAQTIISNPRPSSVQGTTSNRSMQAKSFTKDGKYLMFGNTSTYGGYDVFNVDFDENTVTHAGNWVNNGDIGHSGSITSDGKYILLFDDDSNSRKIFKNNDAGDWSSSTDVTSDFTFEDTDNDQGYGICFFGENSEYFVSTGASGGAVRVYRWYPKKEVTLTFSNPTLTLTGQNVTISSAKLYRDDVLFHTYGTESNVVLRSDQTGTYQAIVNDVYYSNRVTPDFTTTRSVSAPQLEFDGYNKLHLSNITPTSTTLGLPDGTTRDLTTQSNVYIYETGTYTANVQTSDTFAYLSNVVNNVYYSDIQSPYFTDASTIVTDSNWSSSTGFQITSSGNALGASSTSTEYMAFDNIYTAANSWESTWLSTSISMPAWIQIQYPQDVVIKSYTIVGRDATNRYYPTSWQLQGATAAEPSTYVNLETTSGNRTASSWAPLAEVSYDVNTPGTAYRYFRLYVNSSNENDQVSINELKLFTIPLSGQIGVISTPKLTFDGFNKLAIENITQTSSTLTDPNGSTFNTNTASNVYVTDTGEYILEAKDANTFVMSNVYVGAVDTIPEFTVAFHHGTFSASDYSSAYSTVAEAATAGFVYSDTPAGTYSWGTLAHVKERENPDFTANSTLHTDYNSTYGWGDNNEWEVSAKDEFSSTYPVWNAFNKGDGAANNNWLSGSAPSTSSPQWLKIKYPSQQVIKSYVIKARDNASPRFPTAWKLQGSNNDSDWTDIGTEQTVSLWSVASEKSFDVSSNTTAYQYYRLRITGSRESASLSNSDYVAIGQWFLNTVNGENTTNHDQYTRYTYTPASTITANVLRVSGGGGGGGVIAGGGGAGGLLYSENVSLTNSAKSIVVGNGGKGGKGYGAYPQFGTNGYDTSFTGLPISYGGGGGSGSGSSGGSDGGSGGGGNYNYAGGGSGTANQGNSGGNGSGSDGNHGGGGGGAGGAGGNGSGSTGGTGGLGLDYTSTFGTTYGDSGWFASGGGGGGRSGTGGTSSNGGGTNGTGTSTACDDAQNHTGGGGGGAGYNNSQTAYLGGDGGSGIVLIKKLGPINPPALTFDGYNKLTIDNVDTIETATIKKDGAAFATTTSNTVYIRDTGTYTAEVKGSGAYVTEVSKEVTGPISILDEYISEYGTSNYSTYNGANSSGWTTGDWSLRPLRWNRGDRNNSLYVPVPASSSDPFAIDTMFHFYVQSLVANGTSSSGENFPFPTKNGVLWEVDMKNIELSCYNNNARVTGSSLESTYSTGNNGIFFELQCNSQSHAYASTEAVYIYLFYNRTSSTGLIFDFWLSVRVKTNSVTTSTSSTFCLIQNVDLSNDTVLKYGWYAFDPMEGKPEFYLSVGGQTVSETVSFSLNNAYRNFHDETYGGCQVNRPIDPYNDYSSHMGWPFTHFLGGDTRSGVGDNNTTEGATSLKRGLIFDMMYFKYNNVFEQGSNSPSLTYDNYNKITLNQLNYEDTATVSDPNGSIHEIGTAKTMYVKDVGDYVFKISGTDKYVESNVYVSSVDLAGAPTKPIDFDGYNKLTLIDAGSNVSANVTYFSNTYELGSANVLYINGAGTYDLEMSGSNVFALSNTFVGVLGSAPASFTIFPSSIVLGGWWGTNWSGSNYSKTSNTSTKIVYDLAGGVTAVLNGTQYGITFNATNTGIELDLNATGQADTPYTFTSPTISTAVTSGIVTVGQSISVKALNTNEEATFTVPDFGYNSGTSPSLTFDNYNKLTLENFTTTDIEWPPASFTSPSVSDGNPASINGITSTNSAKDAEWVISGASYGNGTYKASTTVAVHETHAVHGPFQMFNKVNGSLDTKTTTTNTSGEWTIELPSSILLYKYNLHHGNAVSTSANYPKDWTIEGSNDGTTWVTLDTRSNETYASSVTGFDVSKREYTVSNNTTKYKHYKLNVSAINSGSYILIGAWRLFEINTRTATLTDPNGDTYSLGQTQNDIYIKDQGDYILEVTNSDQKAIVAKTMGTISTPPVINHVALTSVLLHFLTLVGLVIIHFIHLL